MKFSSSLWLVDVSKIIAAQLIVWHHFFAYSPMADALQSRWPGLADWLYNDARLAVQVFLVIGGFLAARSLAPTPEGVSEGVSRISAGQDVLKQWWLRYMRLALPYVMALALAVVCAAMARQLAAVPDTPAQPTFWQVLAHLLLLQDLFEFDALSAGVWYVAIDFQLYAAFVFLLWVSAPLARIFNMARGTLVVALTAGLCVTSLFWLNRDTSLDIIAPYFFGAYGLGVMAQWASSSHKRGIGIAVMLILTAVALAIEWRSRIAIAGLTAAALVAVQMAGTTVFKQAPRWVSLMGRLAYPLFLVHYPVMLVSSAVVLRLGGQDDMRNMAALAATWGASMLVALLLLVLTEHQRSPLTRMLATLQPRWAKP